MRASCTSAFRHSAAWCSASTTAEAWAVHHRMQYGTATRRAAPQQPLQVAGQVPLRQRWWSNGAARCAACVSFDRMSRNVLCPACSGSCCQRHSSQCLLPKQTGICTHLTAGWCRCCCCCCLCMAWPGQPAPGQCALVNVPRPACPGQRAGCLCYAAASQLHPVTASHKQLQLQYNYSQLHRVVASHSRLCAAQLAGGVRMLARRWAICTALGIVLSKCQETLLQLACISGAMAG
jgi:hypothetical protein